MSAMAPSERAPGAGPALAAARDWAHDRLFDTRGNTILTLFILAVLGALVYTLGRWFVTAADWDVVRANRRLLLVGRFPQGEEWRIWPMVIAGTALVGLSWGAWSRIGPRSLTALAIIGVLILPLFTGGTGRPLAALALALGAVAYVAARRVRAHAGWLRWARRVAIGGWLVTLPIAVRNAAPALAGEMIGLFMSTTLVSVVGLTDMLQAARATTEQPDFFGRQKEVLLFVGIVFWVSAFALSRLSERVEYALSGTRRRR
ncbi:MAG: hypothetical protein CVU47_04275 [Chloroflexi bacterium HGW-Chloroflexi-9]|nr:MAG: hypothetical protein CVU47_04275 [Chloroflexi bacterium HGW-Chloroflexi-9]